jgi:hypothetical protein
MADRNLVKIIINSFPNRDFSGKAIKFVVPINPETYSQNFKIELDTRQGQGDSSTDPRFISTKPEELRLEFILDGTRTMEGYDASLKTKPVREQLDDFKKCVYNYDGKIHRPRFLKVSWGKDLIFPCILSSLEINYSLFNPDGTPLRLKINASFLNYEEQLAREARERNQSPNLTHLRKVTSSDRLDLMTYKIYNDSKYFLQVAKRNNLSSVRNLKTSKELVFPPFNKNEA